MSTRIRAGAAVVLGLAIAACSSSATTMPAAPSPPSAGARSTPGSDTPSESVASPTPSPAPQTPAAAGSPAATAGPPVVTDTQDGFRLVLTLPTTTVPASEPIAGEALLTATDGRETNVAGSGSGLIGFTFEEIGGTRSMGGAMRSNCRAYTLPAGEGFRSSLRPSAAWSDADPNADFYRSFAQASVVRLPAGAWRITAFASFMGAGCTQPPHDLAVSTVVVVTP